MRSFIVFLVMLLASVPVFTQNNWIRVQEIEESFALFDVETEVWVNEEAGVINFEDVSSDSFDDVLFQLSYIMTVFDFVLVDQNLLIEESPIEAIIYSYFRPNEDWTSSARNNRHDKAQFHRYDIHMRRDWLINFFNSSRRDRDDLLYELYNRHYDKWFANKR